MRATVLAIADELTKDDLVLRYRVEGIDTGFSGEEGTFTICSFWLVSAPALIGQTDRARALCQKLLSFAGPLLLHAEEIDAAIGEHLGNFPQAFTHLALIEAVSLLIASELAEDVKSAGWDPALAPRSVRDRKLSIRTDRGACPGATLTPPWGMSRPADEGGHVDPDSPAHRGVDVIRRLASHLSARTAGLWRYSPTPRTWPTRLAAALLPSRDGLSLLPLHAAPT